MPAQAGIHLRIRFDLQNWIPVFTGMTSRRIDTRTKNFKISGAHPRHMQLALSF
jgi:hypothetical protein